MRFLIFITTVALLLLNFEGIEANRRHRRREGGFGNTHNFQRQSWRIQNQGYSDYDQSQYGSDNAEDFGPNPNAQVVDVDDGDIQQSVNDDMEEISGFGQSASAQYRTTDAPVQAQADDSSKAPKLKQGQPEIVTNKGTIRGSLVKVHGGKNVYSFLGIPFAKPPVDQLRFKKPVPSGKFDSVFDASKLPNACFQEEIDIFDGFQGELMWNPNTNTSEDCLYLNIWVPEEVLNSNDNKLVPVLFWIYGGGFFSGSSSLDIYNGANLASQENAVVVSSQYRVGPLGFLFFGVEDAPGNMGFWDQNLALKWTNENIDSFGGDPNLITLFGESAGAASVGYHLLSPESRGYFKRAVMMSGTPTESYSFVHPDILRSRSYKLAKMAGCETRNKTPKDIIECMQKVDPKTIGKLQWRFYKKMLEFPFVPTIDGEFLPDFPTNMMNTGDAKRADLMIGTVANEGSYFVLYQYLKYFHHDKSTSVSRDRFFSIMKEIFADFSDVEQDAIINHYTNWVNPEDGLVNQQRISDAVGDYFFTCPAKKFADAWSNRGLKVFYYHFSQRTSSNPWARWMGVMHSDEIDYFFGKPLVDSTKFTPGEKQLGIYIMRLLSNFATTGTPSEKWERYTTETPIYLNWNATHPTDETPSDHFGPRAEHCAFWNRFLPQLTRFAPATARTQRRPNKSFRRNHMMMHQHQHYPSQPMQCNEYPAQSQSYSNMPQPQHNPWRNRGVHGGQGFHIDTLNQPEQCAPGMSSPHLQTPIAPAVSKSFGQSKPTSGAGFGQGHGMPMPGPGGLPPCNSCCGENDIANSNMPGQDADDDENLVTPIPL